MPLEDKLSLLKSLRKKKPAVKQKPYQSNFYVIPAEITSAVKQIDQEYHLL